MNNVDLAAMIRDCVDGPAQPVTPAEIKARAALPPRLPVPSRVAVPSGLPVPSRRGPKVAIGVGGLAAAGAVAAVAALVVGQAGGGGTGLTRTVLTAAVIKHMASTSQQAMTSGQADIDWTSSGLPSVVQQISFNGANWNDVLNPGVPIKITRTGKLVKQTVGWIDRVVDGQHHRYPALTMTSSGTTQTGESIDRVVDGQDYHYPAFKFTPSGAGFTRGWMRIDDPGAGQPLSIPDPRSLLSVLSPPAGFVADGTSTVNGVTVSHLRATTPGAVAITPLNDIIQSEPDGAQLSAIDLWVDANDVVQKAEVTVTGTNGKGVPQSVTVTVTFSQIGQLQPITAPSSYTTAGGKG